VLVFTNIQRYDAGMTSDEQLELLRACVALRVEGRKVRESIRVALASIEDTLVEQAGPLVRKTVAARLLGVSVQAIDRHVAAGRIATEPIAPGASRSAIPIRPLLDIAYEQHLGRTSLARALENAAARRARTTEFLTARNLTLFAQQIAQAARTKAAS
jgi:hypothetical protein